MSDQRTEDPTQRRIEEARRKGESVGRSRELSMALTLGAGVIALQALIPGAARSLADLMRSSVVSIGDKGVGGHLAERLGAGMGQSVGLVLPLAVTVMLAGVIANVASGGLVFSTHAIRFDPSRMNPLKGLKRIADKQALVRLVISVVKLAILAFVSWQVVSSRIPLLIALDGATAGRIAGAAMSAMFELGIALTFLLGGVALADLVIQRRQAKGQLKMSRDQVKRENREQEGDPLVKGQRRRRARQLAFARMIDAVKSADVVVTNPTRLAVALKYDSLTMKAPKIVAKGQRFMAARIREVAREHGIPLIEDKPLARALFPRPLGSDVPPNLYRAVARLLVVIHEARFGLRRTAPRRGVGRPATGGTA